MRLNTFEYNKIKDIILEFVEEEDTRSFTSGGVYSESYETILKKIYKLVEILKEKENVDLKDFIKKYEDKIFKDYDLISKCGFMDCLLYWYDKDKGILAGYTFHDADDNEYYIKYNYGYCNYDMGIKYILQSFNNLDEYFRETAKKYTKSFLDETQGILTDNIFHLVKKYGDNYISYTNIYYACKSNKGCDYNHLINQINEYFENFDVQYEIVDDIMQVNIGKEKISSFPDKYLQDAKQEIDVNISMKKYNI